MNSKNIAIITITALAILGFIWYQKSTPTLPPDNSLSTVDNKTATQVTPTASKPATGSSLPRITKDGIYIINYLPSGFVPRTLEVPIGKSVRFVNNSGKAMRISSTDTTNNPVYNAFNQSKTVGQGGIYEYTFTDKGIFGYRNLNNPVDQGVVTIVK